MEKGLYAAPLGLDSIVPEDMPEIEVELELEPGEEGPE